MTLQPTHALEPFAGSFETADGFSVLAGGLCPVGTRAASLQALSALQQLSLGSSKDCVVIDARLSQMLRQSAPEHVRFLAASVYVPGAPELCGGIAGDIDCQESSADGDFVQLDEAVFGFALPGAGAILFAGAESDARRLHSIALRELDVLPLSRESICFFLEQAFAFSGQFLFVTDGSGGSTGCMALQSGSHRSILWLNSHM